MSNNELRGTTIVGVKRDGKTAIAGDGQMTLGNMVMKATSKKVRRIYKDQVVIGFAGVVADAFNLCEKFEKMLNKFSGNLMRSAVELALIWREDKAARNLEATLIVADKKDSTGICFIGERNFKEFLKNYIPANKGKIIDINSNEVVGEHDGVMYYTIGQRKGLGIGGISGREPRSWFVCYKDVKNNILYVADEKEDEHLFSDRAIIKNINWLAEGNNEPLHVGCKFRYRQQDNGVTLKFIDDDTIELIFDEPYKAVTTGQAAVFYMGTRMLGGGIIEEIYYKGKRIEIKK